jgi:amino acid adenylation domain-containing protein
MNMGSIIDDAARLCPDKVAVSDGERSHTFAELQSLSANFASFLLSNEVKRGDRIAFCSEKSSTLVAAIIGCVKVGAIYVPIDCKLPKSRLHFILNDVRPRFIVAAPALYDELAAGLEVKSGLIDEDHLLDCDGDGDVPFPEISPDDVAYCIYTSGSTGRPKGVLIQHGSLDAFYRAFAEVMTISASSKCLNTSPLQFDVHLMDLFYPLYCGASLRLFCGPVIADDLLQTIEQEKITHFTAVGPIMTLMVEGSTFETRDLSSIERIMTGAEIINVNTMQKWLRRVPGLAIVNGYGPTEATVICTFYVIDRIEPGRTQFYPIGKPLDGTKVALLDQDRIVTGPGAKGELLIGGPQVMQGYWNDPAQTREKIVDVDGARYYKSGDICEWRADGDLDYIGRVDEEIKLLGFRISLSEIKRVMDTTQTLAEGHPVVIERTELGKVIAACFTLAGRRLDRGADHEKIFAQLQSEFKRSLPYYMVPSLYFLFDQFPKLPSGKTDRNQITSRVNRQLDDAGAGMTRFVCH